MIANVTIAGEADIIHLAKIEAAKANQSLSKWIFGLVQAQVKKNDAYEIAKEQALGRLSWGVSNSDAKFNRNEMYAERLDRFR